MRLALISDIHGNLAALEAVAADIARRGADRVVVLGDNVSGPLLPSETARYLMASGWLTLAGNHERQILHPGPGGRAPSDHYAFEQLSDAELAWLRTLPPTARFDDVFLCHGTPGSDLEYFLESVQGDGIRLASADEIESRTGGETAALIACGHTHHPRAVRRAGGQLIVNPGSVGLPAFFTDWPTPHAVQTGSPDARYAIAERSGDTWSAESIAVPYDFAPMATLAERRGRPDWAHALSTGYMP
ncbi:MAG TPA: metallophosphoesterase family protein [Luteimonas sp.]|nr:metallophosphoesterase family protein [Luteimonas sp.]